MIRIAGLSEPPRDYAGAEVLLPLEGPDAALRLDLSALENLGRAPLPPRLRDALEWAALVHAADLALPRGRNEDWVRDWRLLTPVRDLRFWGRHQAEAQFLVYFLTRDRVALDFTARVADHVVATSSETLEVDCVSLLSGGLDSLAAGVVLLRTGRRPLLVSVETGNPSVAAAQTASAAALSRLAARPVPHVTVRCVPTARQPPRGLPPSAQREPSQRARSLLFLTAGAVAALQVNVGDLYVGENGVLAAHLPLSAARCGSFSTRTAHPVLLARFGRLLSAAGECKLTVQNPLLHQTKTQVVRDVLAPALTVAEIQSTVSCWQAGRLPRPCGSCLPCLLRRFAFEAAGLPVEAHMLDLLSAPEEHRDTDGFVNLADLLLQARVFATAQDARLLRDYPDLLDFNDPAAVMDTYRRHSRELLSVVASRYPRVQALVGGALPQHVPTSRARSDAD